MQGLSLSFLIQVTIRHQESIYSPPLLTWSPHCLRQCHWGTYWPCVAIWPKTTLCKAPPQPPTHQDDPYCALSHQPHTLQCPDPKRTDHAKSVYDKLQSKPKPLRTQWLQPHAHQVVANMTTPNADAPHPIPHHQLESNPIQQEGEDTEWGWWEGLAKANKGKEEGTRAGTRSRRSGGTTG
jgi:hypothetical protein